MRPTRSNSKKTNVNTVVVREEPRQRVVLMDRCLYEKGNVTAVRLRHPGSELPVFFILESDAKTVYELIQFQESNRSWFINSTVSSCGKCYTIVPFNKIYFAIYYLRKYCSQNAVPVNQIKDEEAPLPSYFTDQYFDSKSLDFIADRKGPPELMAYKYNKDKVLKWLGAHVKNLVKKFKEESTHVSESALSANYVRSEKIQSEVTEEEYLKYACGIIGNYIVIELHDELLSYFNIKDEALAKRRSIEKFEAPQIKKLKLEIESSDPIFNENEIKVETKEKDKKITSKEKSLAKAAKGNKSIMSFFKK